MDNNTKKESRAHAFVRFIIDRIQADKGIAAALRRADNPSTEYQSWEYLATFGVDLENARERLIFGLIASAIAKAKIQSNGILNLGEAISQCYETKEQAKPKLRRLLACDSVEEVCAILRPLLQLINANCNGSLDFARLLDGLIYFKKEVKAGWAQNFYGGIA